jgi:rhodanese-related sulfurtransferase
MSTSITPQHVQSQAADSYDLIDVRSPAEFGSRHAAPARNIPLDKFDAVEVLDAPNTPGRPIYLMCQSGARSEQARQRLVAAGAQNVCCVEGGIPAWDSAGLPVVRGKQTVSLERQVRILAGGLACAGAVLALTVHPYWAGLPAFIGVGLVFAGLTDTCGMGLLLARMPWNR